MERNLRLVTGLTLFAYAACHFLGHASGIFGVAAMETIGRDILLAPWRTPPLRAVLLIFLFLHGGLGLRALFRRRHLRIPALEAWQLALGLAIPPLLIKHVVNVRGGAAAFDVADTYHRVLSTIGASAGALWQHFFLLGLVWAHGCIGLHYWLSRHDWYRRRRELFLAAAVALPFSAALGVTNAGWDVADVALRDPAAATSTGSPAEAAALADWTEQMQIAYGALVGLVVLVWLWRNGLHARSSAARITYPGGRVVVAPRGFSILETSRWAGIPHASSCGGRGRCSTCRVRVVAGEGDTPAMLPAERETLDRIKAPAHVRLACQLRPTADIEVAPLVAPVAASQRDAHSGDRESHEMLVTAMFVDLRDSTRFAAGRLPFDALYVVEHYVELVTAAIESHGGVVTGVAGDGVMSLFGVGDGPRAGARGALRAIGAVWDAIAALSSELAGELDRPLAFGAGLHSSPCAVRSVTIMGRPSLQFLGDAGNVASRLEAATKTHACVCVVSEAVFELAQAAIPEGLARQELAVRGLDDRLLPVRMLRERAQADFEDFAAPREDAAL
jgi:adenylate cyclase